MNLQQIMEIELAYERRDSERLMVLCPAVAKMLQAFWEHDYGAVYKAVGSAFAQSRSAEEKVFWLQWAIAAAELSDDLPARKRWLKQWADVSDWAVFEYCRYLRSYHDGVSAFAQSNLSDAERHFRCCLEASLSTSYARGVMRSLFHLGLVCRDSGRQDEALEYLRHALSKARELGTAAFMERVDGALAALGKEPTTKSTVSHYMAFVERELRGGKFESAQRSLCQAEVLRRRSRLGRGYHRLITYLVPIRAAFGRLDHAQKLLRFLHDPILRIKALSLWNEVVPLEGALGQEFRVLLDVYGISSPVEHFSMDLLETKVCGIRLRDVSDEGVRKLLEALLGSKVPLSKEQICQKVWGLEYDPVLHDNKIYKLFHKARKIFHTPNLLSNHYGAYSLNRNAFRKDKKVS